MVGNWIFLGGDECEVVQMCFQCQSPGSAAVIARPAAVICCSGRTGRHYCCPTLISAHVLKASSALLSHKVRLEGLDRGEASRSFVASTKPLHVIRNCTSIPCVSRGNQSADMRLTTARHSNACTPVRSSGGSGRRIVSIPLGPITAISARLDLPLVPILTSYAFQPLAYLQADNDKFIGFMKF